jgi:hypothetical protein
MRPAVDDLLSREERQGIIFILIALLTIGGVIWGLAALGANRPAPTRDKLYRVEGVVYAVNPRATGKGATHISFLISTRLPSGGSWTGTLTPCLIMEPRLAALPGTKSPAIYRLVDVPVVVSSHNGAIVEITANGEAVLTFEEVALCSKTPSMKVRP